jgi:hypothetical protein
LQWLGAATSIDTRCRINLLVLPCISPWGYETIKPLEPRRARSRTGISSGESPAESALAMACVAAHGGRVDMHLSICTND